MRRSKFYYDLHTHSIFSDGRCSLYENVLAAEALGLTHIAITDHFYKPSLIDWVDKARAEVERLRSKFSVKILLGAEVTTLDVLGRVSLELDTAKKFDLILADFFSGDVKIKGIATTDDKDKVIENVTACLIALSQNPVVDIIAHPFNLGRLPFVKVKPRDFPVKNLERIAIAFRKNRKIFEIMSQMWWWFLDMHPANFTEEYVELVKIFAGHGVQFSMGSDAHSVCGVGNLAWSQEVIKKAGIGKKQLIDPEIFVR